MSRKGDIVKAAGIKFRVIGMEFGFLRCQAMETAKGFVIGKVYAFLTDQVEEVLSERKTY